MAVENVNSKPIAASAAIADFILASIGGKVRRVPISTLAETLTDAEVELISAAASALVSAAGRACYIGENENWYVWDGAQGAFIDSGYSVFRSRVPFSHCVIVSRRTTKPSFASSSDRAF